MFSFFYTIGKISRIKMLPLTNFVISSSALAFQIYQAKYFNRCHYVLKKDMDEIKAKF